MTSSLPGRSLYEITSGSIVHIASTKTLNAVTCWKLAVKLSEIHQIKLIYVYEFIHIYYSINTLLWSFHIYLHCATFTLIAYISLFSINKICDYSDLPPNDHIYHFNYIFNYLPIATLNLTSVGLPYLWHIYIIGIHLISFVQINTYLAIFPSYTHLIFYWCKLYRRCHKS